MILVYGFYDNPCKDCTVQKKVYDNGSGKGKPHTLLPTLLGGLPPVTVKAGEE